MLPPHVENPAINLVEMIYVKSMQFAVYLFKAVSKLKVKVKIQQSSWKLRNKIFQTSLFYSIACKPVDFVPFEK